MVSRPGILLCSSSGIILALYLPLISLLIAGGSECREIRPSVHGLTNQSTPTGVKSPEMVSFFGGSSKADMELPRAKNSSETPWWRSTAGGGAPDGFGQGKSHDHVRDVLLVASLVCGVVGFTLLVATGLFFVFRFRRSSSK